MNQIAYDKLKADARLLLTSMHRWGVSKYPCVVCGNPKSERHHPDYRQPWCVVNLCRKCHKIHHHHYGMAKQWLGQYPILDKQGNVIEAQTHHIKAPSVSLEDKAKALNWAIK